MKRSLIISCSIALLAATTNLAQNTNTTESEFESNHATVSPSFDQNGMIGESSGSTEKDFEFDLEAQITVYPNPAVGKVTVHVPAHFKLNSAQLNGLNGHLTDLPIPTADPSGQDITFDLSNEYDTNPRILVLKTSKGVFTKKIVFTRTR